MRTALIHAPFCTPASPPYSLAHLYSFLKRNGHRQLDILDLNLDYHRSHYPAYFKALTNGTADLKALLKETRRDYATTNTIIRKGGEPEDVPRFVSRMLEKKVTTAVFSIVYSSQAFYAYALIKKLQEKGIKTIIGGPAVTPQLHAIAERHLTNEVQLLEALQQPIAHEKLDCRTLLDYSAFPLQDYFSPQPVLPIKTCTSCYYQRCAFCTHHQHIPYREFSLQDIAMSITRSEQKYFFFIDDMMHKKRLLELATTVKPLNIRWMCQLRPTKDLDRTTLKTVYDAGLRVVLWGVESGSQRVLNLMNKGTTVSDISHVLDNSKDVGITNVTFIMFGFPTETKEEFHQTIQFLKNNSDHIDLVSTSLFGLQRNAPAYKNPQEFGISAIHTAHRDLLDTSITFTPSSGLTTDETRQLKKKYARTLQQINKVPKEMNFFREHLLASKD